MELYHGIHILANFEGHRVLRVRTNFQKTCFEKMKDGSLLSHSLALFHLQKTSFKLAPTICQKWLTWLTWLTTFCQKLQILGSSDYPI